MKDNSWTLTGEIKIRFAIFLHSWPEDGQLFQRVLAYVERGETKSNSDRSFNPIHRQAFVQPTDDTLRSKSW